MATSPTAPSSEELSKPSSPVSRVLVVGRISYWNNHVVWSFPPLVYNISTPEEEKIVKMQLSYRGLSPGDPYVHALIYRLEADATKTFLP
jgi:hypothetical protein